jgi:exonuclease SbcD
LKYSFSEVRQKKSVTLVELREKGDLRIEALPLVPLHDLREIKGELAWLLRDEVSSLEDTADYLRVILTDEEEIIDPLGKVRRVYPNVMVLGFDNSRSHIDLAGITPEAGTRSLLSPYDLFCEFYLDSNGAVISGEQARIVRKLMETEVAT